MPDTDHAVSVLTAGGTVLDEPLVKRLGAQLAAVTPEARAVVLDCQSLADVTPRGLAALLELGTRPPGGPLLALAGLSRRLTMAAIEVGLAERFAVYVSAEAARRALCLREPWA